MDNSFCQHLESSLKVPLVGCSFFANHPSSLASIYFRVALSSLFCPLPYFPVSGFFPFAEGKLRLGSRLVHTEWVRSETLCWQFLSVVLCQYPPPCVFLADPQAPCHLLHAPPCTCVSSWPRGHWSLPWAPCSLTCDLPSGAVWRQAYVDLGYRSPCVHGVVECGARGRQTAGSLASGAGMAAVRLVSLCWDGQWGYLLM